MPVIAIGAAIFAGSSIAVAGGLAAFAASAGVFSAIAAVGAIASGIGVITGNKALTQIGAIAGLAGGVGAFATSQGWLAGGASGADAANGLTGATEAVSNTGQMIAEAAPGMVDPSANLAGAATAAADGTAGATSLAGDAASSSWGGEARGLVNSSPTAAAITEPLSQATDAAGTWGREVRTSGYTPSAGGPATSKSIFDSFKDISQFMEKNQKLTSMGMGALENIFGDEGKAKVTQANALADYYSAKTSESRLNQEQQRQQMANMNAVPDLTGLKINPAVRIFNTGAPPAYNSPRAGLINSTGR